MTRRPAWGIGLGVLCLLAATAAAAEDHGALESSLFTESVGTTATPAAGAPPEPTFVPTPEAKSVGFSGQITSAVIDLASTTRTVDSLYTYTVADVYLDARLERQAKVFADLEATYFSQSQLTQVALQEMFFDFNLDQAAYFRTGKQVLQWGRCYLWNPTDLINVEKQHFIPKIGTRAGAYGMKVHVPFGTTVNIYDFIDTGSAADAESIANALKFECLVGNLEVALSGWGKKGYAPVWGLDFSTRILGIDTLGEVSVSQEDNQIRARLVDDALVAGPEAQAWAPRASVDLSRSFTVGDFKDRLTVRIEGYYDRAGYDSNVLSDPTDYAFARPAYDPGTGALVTHGTLKDFITFNNLYQSNYFSRGYVALFTTFTEFILTDGTLSANYIRNLVDASSLVSAGVSYTALNSFTVGLLADGYFGDPDREYTFSGEKYDIQLTLAISF